MRHIISTKNDIERTEAQLEDQYQKTKLLRRSISELDTIKQNMAQFNTVSIAKGQELQVIYELEQLATHHTLVQKL